MSHSTDPICGHCGKPLSKHFHEDRVYCFADTTGDLFDTEPSPYSVACFLEARHPALHAQVVAEWKKENGHSP